VILNEERWVELRRFRALHASGAMSVSEIARETGLHRQTVRKYLSSQAPPGPPRGSSRQGTQARVVTEVAPLIDAMLRAELLIKGTVVHERLVEQYGFTGNYQRVKLYLQEARPRIAAELGIGPDELRRLHRRFEVIPGAQAQVDWGDEGRILAHVGIKKVYFGGVPAAIVYDRTKTVVRRHVAPGKAVPLHPEAVAFAGHYDFDIDVLAAYRPTGKGRVERQVAIVRDHVLAGRAFCSLEEMDAAFTAWVPLRRARTHATHGEVIGVRAARDHAALRPMPQTPYLVTRRHLRHVGKDCLVAFEGNLYSVPARQVRHRQLVEIRAGSDMVFLHSTAPETAGRSLLAAHPRAFGRGQRVVDEAHWEGLPDGHTRAVTTSADAETNDGNVIPLRRPAPAATGPLQALLTRSAAAQVEVERRPLSVYDQLAGTRPFTPATIKDHR
jgi:transposase